MSHGIVQDGWLVKQGKQVQKFWKHNGYGLALSDLDDIKGVVLHTQYDGILWATKEELLKHGQEHMFNDEKQLIMGVHLWHLKDS